MYVLVIGCIPIDVFSHPGAVWIVNTIHSKSTTMNRLIQVRNGLLTTFRFKFLPYKCFSFRCSNLWSHIFILQIMAHNLHIFSDLFQYCRFHLHEDSLSMLFFLCKPSTLTQNKNRILLSKM